MTELLNIASWLCLGIGAFFVLSGGMGLLRFPDFFTRLHPAGLKDSMGAPLMLFGLMLKAGLTLTSVKIALLILFILITSPTSCHALARAALASGMLPMGAIRDEDQKPKPAKKKTTPKPAKAKKKTAPSKNSRGKTKAKAKPKPKGKDGGKSKGKRSNA